MTKLIFRIDPGDQVSEAFQLLETRKNPGLLSDFMIHFGEPLGRAI